ncbi:hypothetical protein P9112_004487 [Eukaryota sp. TZLM1-RC]
MDPVDLICPDRWKHRQPLFLGQIKATSWSNKTQELFCLEDIIVTLDSNGSAEAYSRTTLQHLCSLRINDDYIVRSLFTHTLTKSVITVTTLSTESHSALRVVSFPLDHIRKGDAPSTPTFMFTTEILKYPGFVEFDSRANRAITFSAPDQVYRVWDLSTYCGFLYSLSASDVLEVKINYDRLVVFHKPDSEFYLNIKVYDLQYGKLLCTSRLKLESRGYPFNVNPTVLYTESVGDSMFCYCPIDNNNDDELNIVAKLSSTVLDGRFDEHSCTILTDDESLLVSFTENKDKEIVVNCVDATTGKHQREYSIGKEMQKRNIPRNGTCIAYLKEERVFVVGHLDNSVSIWRL